MACASDSNMIDQDDMTTNASPRYTQSPCDKLSEPEMQGSRQPWADMVDSEPEEEANEDWLDEKAVVADSHLNHAKSSLHRKNRDKHGLPAPRIVHIRQACNKANRYMKTEAPLQKRKQHPSLMSIVRREGNFSVRSASALKKIPSLE